MLVVMQEDEESLDKVVVIGYGTQKKKDVTGAITTINEKDLEKPLKKNLIIKFLSIKKNREIILYSILLYHFYFNSNFTVTIVSMRIFSNSNATELVSFF